LLWEADFTNGQLTCVRTLVHMYIFTINFISASCVQILWNNGQGATN